MSVSRTSHYTPRSSASQGRIVTANSSLSAQFRGDSEGTPALQESPANNPHSFNVVSSDLSVVNSSPRNTNSQTDQDKVEYVVVSKSRTSLNTNTDIAYDNTSRLDNNNSESKHTDNNQPPQTNHTTNRQFTPPNQQSNNQEKGSVGEHSRGDSSNRYNYYSLKSSSNVSRNNINSNTLINKSQLESGLNGSLINKSQQEFGGGSNSVHGVEADANANSITVTSHPDDGSVNDINVKSASNLRSHSHSTKEQDRVDFQKNNIDAQQSGGHINDHSLNAPQHTRLSLYSQQDSVSQFKEPHSVDVEDQSVPHLDLSRLSDRKSQASDSDSDPISPTPQSVVLLSPKDQNLHASDKKSPLIHFTPHDNHRTARTYEVDTPIASQQLPLVKSSANFRGQPDTYRDSRGPAPFDQDTFRQREDDRPSQVGSIHSDLADDLRIPYQFDTQAQEARQTSYHDKPPSPPIPLSPPQEKEPATSLRSNSQVYAVANPEILRAQGINPPPNSQFTPRQYSNRQRRSGSGVRFDSGSKRQSGSRENNSPVRDRAPTPYNKTPPRSPGEYRVEDQRRRSRASSRNTQGLPPQHPPLDTKHRNSARTDNRSAHRSEYRAEQPSEPRNKQLEDTGSMKRVYVESPTFTKEEEEEYRFVNSRLEDIDDKAAQATFREMNRNKQGYPDQGNVKNDYDRNRDRGDDQYNRKPVEQDRFSDKNRERYEDQNREQYEDQNRDRYEDQNRGRYEDRNDQRNHETNGYSVDKNRERLREVDRNDRNDYRDDNRYEDRNKYDPYNSQEKYDRLRDERARFDREPHREEDPDFRQGYRKQNTELDAQELFKEQEYQRELKQRIEKQKIKESNYVPPQHQGEYESNNFARDSLDYTDDRDKGFPRDSLEYNANYVNQGHQGQEWGDPPQNPYQEKQDQYYQNEYDQQQQPEYAKEDSRPAFYDPEDALKMEVVNPTKPRYDYVNLNKHDYGLPPKKSYRDLVLKKKEEEEKLETVFISPKVPPKHGKKKKAQSAQPEHMGHQPPVQHPMGFKPSSAEELWAMRSNTLQNPSAGSKKGKGSASKPMSKKWNSNPNIKQQHTFKAPPPLPNQGQNYKPPNSYNPSSPNGYNAPIGQGYTTPPRGLQPMENKPAAPISTEYVPTALEPNSPFRRHMELKPITQEIVTDDGQRISVDINLRLVSPPPGHGNSPPPGQQQQLALIPVQETQGPNDQMRGIGVPYNVQDQYGYVDNGYQPYQELQRQQLRDSLLASPREKKSVTFGAVQDGYQGNGMLELEGRYSGNIEEQIAHEHMALADQTANNGYSKGLPESPRYREDELYQNDGYTAMYHKSKSKDPNEKPWYKVYDISDYKKMQREVRLNRGALGPDLDTEPFKEKLEKRHKQFEYARMVMEKNKMELASKKPPHFPKNPEKLGEENIKRKAALDYSKTIPKPTVKPRPNQYNSYEVAAQLGGPGHSPKTRQSPASKTSPTPTKTVDVIDIHSLEQRHIQERKNADKIRQTIAQKAH